MAPLPVRLGVRITVDEFGTDIVAYMGELTAGTVLINGQPPIKFTLDQLEPRGTPIMFMPGGCLVFITYVARGYENQENTVVVSCRHIRGR